MSAISKLLQDEPDIAQYTNEIYEAYCEDLEPLQAQNKLLMEAVEHYAGEPFDSNDIYLDIWDLIEQVSPSVREFDSDKFAEKAREALKQVKELRG